MAHQQRPPPRTRSSTALSSSSVSSSVPGSPGPSVSIRAMTRSTTPVATPALSASARSSPGPSYLTTRTMSTTSSSYTSNAVPSTSKPSRPGHVRDRSTSNLSVATSSASTRTAAHHNRRQQTLMGGNANSKLSRSQLATYNSSSAVNRTAPGMISPPVPDILINGAERPEDVDIASIGRLPSLSAASPVRSSPEATSIGVDGLFAKFGVKEVRSIAQRGRAKAESKREELRTMVGERYRDLLGAADSIVRMRRSSSVLLDRLARARQECDRDAMLSRAAEEDMTRSHMLSRAATPLVSGHTPYSVATLVKLLLDCPEYIWRCIERQDYLSAARLDSVGRAVYRELVSAGKRRAVTPKSRRSSTNASDDGNDSAGYDSEDEDGDDGGLTAAFPLVEQQFDTLDSLAPQISSRASLHLRAWDVSASNVADSLATLLMLDRISIADGLQLLLDQRSKTLSNLFQDSLTPSTPSLRRPSAMPTNIALDGASLSASATQSSESKALRDAVQRSTEALALILATHEHVMQCFSSSEGGSDPLLIRLLRLLQQSTTNPAESPNTTLSMIQVQATSSRSSTEILQPILATLPNAHLFLRYLPEQIITFTPYIDIDSADSELKREALKQKLDTWFLETIKTFEDGISKLFEALGDARQLAEVKTTIRDYLQQRPSTAGVDLSEQLAKLLATLEVALGQRFVEIYTRKIDNIAKIVPEALEGALRALPSSQEDLHPVDFIFSTSLPFPSSSIFPTNASATSVGKRASLDPFTIFKKAMLDRVSGRSPVLSSCLQQLEFTSGEMQADMVAWLREMPDESAKEVYTATARKGLNKIEDVLRDLLDKEAGIPEQLFIGSVAVHLALDSTFVQLLLLLPGTDNLPDNDKKNLLELERKSKEQWRETNVKKAAGYLRESLLDQLDFPTSEYPTRNTGLVLDSLSILADAINQLGAHRAGAISDGITELLQDFEKALFSDVFDADLVDHIKAAKTEDCPKQAQQMQANVALLRQVITAAFEGTNISPSARWSELEQTLKELADSEETESQKSKDTLLRTQNLLAPLLSSSKHALKAQTGTASLLLPLGTPQTASASEGMLDLAKPGPRLALLPVNPTAA